MTMIGRTYLLRGEPVVVIAKWLHVPGPRQAPRNVLIRHADGRMDVRPFRGLRRLPAATLPPSDA